jgi:cytochrome c556
MKSSYQLVAFPLFLMGVLLFMTADDAGAGTALEQSMKQMGTAYKELSDDLKQPQDAGKDQYLALVATIRDQAKMARDQTPRLAQTLPADQRDAMVQAYQKDMDKFMQDVDSLGDALKNSQWDDARKLMGALSQEMFDGHKQYRAQKHSQSHPPAPSEPAPQAQNPAPAAPSSSAPNPSSL